MYSFFRRLCMYSVRGTLPPFAISSPSAGPQHNPAKFGPVGQPDEPSQHSINPRGNLRLEHAAACRLCPLTCDVHEGDLWARFTSLTDLAKGRIQLQVAPTYTLHEDISTESNVRDTWHSPNHHCSNCAVEHELRLCYHTIRH